MSKTNIYKAEALLKERKRKGKTEYLVKWCGWSSKHNSWEPRENIIDERLIEEFEARNARKALRRGGYRKAVKRVKQSIAHDESNDDEINVDPSPSRRRGRPRKQPRLSEDALEAEEKDNKGNEAENKKVGSLSLEKEQEEDEEGGEEAPAADEEDESEIVEEEHLRVEKCKPEEKEGEKVEDETSKKGSGDAAFAVTADHEAGTESKVDSEINGIHEVTLKKFEQQPSVSKPSNTKSLELISSIMDEEAGPSTINEKHTCSVEAKEPNMKAKDIEEVPVPSKAEKPVSKESSDKNVTSIPRTFHGHMIPMRIEPSERQEEVRTHAFVISEPGASATTEELQVFSEVEQIQAIKNELMNESGWSKHEAIRHDSFQYNGTHALTEIIGKDGEPVRFISL